MFRFKDRREAGALLAQRLAGRDPDALVLALPRGGVPVGYEIARALRLPLDVFLVRKLGLPGYEELAIGAIASGGVVVLNDDVVNAYGVPRATIDRVIDRQKAELGRRESVYRGTRAVPVVEAREVIIVDDGLATGSTMRAAVEALRAQNPARIIVAVPAGAAEACADLSRLADALVCLWTPRPFYAVGNCYDAFPQTSDDEVNALLAAARANFT